MRDYLIAWEGISVKSMIREALKVQTTTPDEREIEYMVEECTPQEEQEILGIGLTLDYIVDVPFKNQLLTMMLEHHITHKQNLELCEEVNRQVHFFYALNYLIELFNKKI